MIVHNTSALVSDLPRLPLCNYSVSITGHNGAGWSSAATGLLGMPIDVPSAPVGVVAVPSNNRSVLGTWQPPVDDGGSPVRGYTVTAIPVNAALPSVNVSVNAGSNGIQAVPVDGLVAAQAYNVAVQAWNVAGRSTAAAAGTKQRNKDNSQVTFCHHFVLCAVVAWCLFCLCSWDCDSRPATTACVLERAVVARRCRRLCRRRGHRDTESCRLSMQRRVADCQWHNISTMCGFTSDASEWGSSDVIPVAGSYVSSVGATGFLDCHHDADVLRGFGEVDVPVGARGSGGCRRVHERDCRDRFLPSSVATKWVRERCRRVE